MQRQFWLVTRKMEWKSSGIPAFTAKRLEKGKSRSHHILHNSHYSSRFLVTAAVSLASRTPLDLGSKAFETANLDIRMSNGMFYLFCFAMIILGLIAVASAVVLISSRSDDVIVPLATGILIYGVELALYLKPLVRILWDVNLLKLLRPYTMLSVSLYFDSTIKALAANVIAFILVSVALFLLTFADGSEIRAKRTLSSQSS